MQKSIINILRISIGVILLFLVVPLITGLLQYLMDYTFLEGFITGLYINGFIIVVALFVFGINWAFDF